MSNLCSNFNRSCLVKRVHIGNCRKWVAIAIIFPFTGAAATARPHDSQHGETTFSSLPGAAQSIVSATLGRNDMRYRVRAKKDVLRVHNPAQTLEAEFSRQGTEVGTGQGHWHMRLLGYGYGERLREAGEAGPVSSENRVEYRREGLLEWYANGPAGLEQGFTLSAPPGERVAGEPLTLALGLTEI